MDNTTDPSDNVVCDKCGKEFTSENGVMAEKKLMGHKAHCKGRDRDKRIPFGAPERKLNCPDDDQFHYRIFNDNWRMKPGRVQRAVQAGYEVVQTSDEPVSVGSNDDGTEIKGILMRIPKDMYEKDQEVKQIDVDRVDEQIYQGTLASKDGDKRYKKDIRITVDN